MLILNAAEVTRCLPMAEAIEGLRAGFAALERGQVDLPVRTQLSMPDGDGISLFMPAYLDTAAQRHTSLKVVSVYPGNPRRNLPVIHGLVILLDPETGRIRAGMDGGAVTAIRTGAVSGLATDLLAPAAARTLAVFGAGVQARTQMEAVCAVRELDWIKVYAPTASHIRALIEDMRPRIPEHVSLRAASSPRDALRGSGIVSTATTSSAPVFADEDLEEGTHINAVGVFEPHKREIPGQTVLRSRLYVDEMEAALEEAGDILTPIREGRLESSHILGTLGALVEGTVAGRTRAEEITLFKSVGLAVQDTVSAATAYANARSLGLGTEVEL